MSIIRGSPVTPLVVKAYLAYIEDVLVKAGEYGGKAFGSFVRNVIVSRMKDPTCNVLFDNVDLWFTSEEKVKQFLEHIQPRTSDGCQYNFSPVTPVTLTERYGYCGKVYNFIMYGTYIAWFNIFISDVFPVADFDVNCLTYIVKRDYSNGTESFTKQLQGERGFQKDCLINVIVEKQATMFGRYADKIRNNTYGIGKIHRFINRGWTIKFGKIKITKISEISLLLDAVEPGRIKDSADRELKLSAGRKAVNQQTTITSSAAFLTVEEQEAAAFKGLKISPKIMTLTPSLDDTLEDLIRNNPLVKDAVARIITNMICESATAIESKLSAK